MCGLVGVDSCCVLGQRYLLENDGHGGDAGSTSRMQKGGGREGC